MKKLQAIRLLLTENGLLWTVYCIAYFGLRYLFKCDIHALYRRMGRLEMKYNLPGISNLAINYEFWQNRDWKEGGEEWNLSSQWKQSLIDEVLLKYIEQGKTVLEIGPGAGRWTETLQKISRELIIVDLSDKCINLCKKRFSQCDNIKFFVNDGSNLDFIPSETIGFIWAFDVFVHLSPQYTEKYLIGFVRILRKGGRGIIHHSKEGGLYGGCRSRMTAELFSEMLKKHGLTLVTQFDSWGNKGQFNVRLYHDTITVFEK